MSEITIQQVRRAAQRIEPFAHRTPVITSATLDQISGRQLFFKCENLQKVGAFKFRGACNAVAQLSPQQRARGVVTHSSGNHAQALALAARLYQTKAYIVMPRGASQVKRDAVLSYGGKIVDCEANLQSREDTAAQVQRDTGAAFIHPYDDPRIIAGQGTATLELLSQVQELQAIVAPLGGGGLISGTCVTAGALAPRVGVLAAEPAGADDAARSKQAGQLILQTAPETIADGLRTSLGRLTWPYVRDKVQGVITVSDQSIVAAMRLFWQHAKLIIEPSAAVALAAVLDPAFGQFPGDRVGIILSGGNVDLDRLPW